MSHLNLLCNFRKCRKEIQQYAYVTTCSHVLCNEHGLSITTEQNPQCPVCSNYLNTNDIIRTDLHPDETTKTVSTRMMMAGFKPELIMDITSRALTFWSHQITQEFEFMYNEVKNSQENIDVMRNYCENLHSKLNIETASRDRKINSLQQELDSLKKRCEELVGQLHQKTKALSKLQLDMLKRGATNTTVSNDPKHVNASPTRRNMNYSSADIIDQSNLHQRVPSRAFGINFSSLGEHSESEQKRRPFHLHTVEEVQPLHSLDNYFQSPTMYPPMHPMANMNNQTQPRNFQPSKTQNPNFRSFN